MYNGDYQSISANSVPATTAPGMAILAIYCGDISPRSCGHAPGITGASAAQNCRGYRGGLAAAPAVVARPASRPGNPLQIAVTGCGCRLAGLHRLPHPFTGFGELRLADTYRRMAHPAFPGPLVPACAAPGFCLSRRAWERRYALPYPV